MSPVLEWRVAKRDVAAQRGAVRSFYATSNLLVALIGAAIFGPYVGATGLRTEQVVIYGLLLLTFPFVFPRTEVNGGMRFLLPWSAYVLVATLSVLFPPRTVQPLEPGSVIAGYDNILLPIVALLIVWALVSPSSARETLATFCKVVAGGMAANGAIAIIATRVSLEAWLRPFWARGAGETVATRAAELGRLAGVFNQPAEAGTMYGLAGVAAVYAWRRRPVLLASILTLITVGGLLSVSKAFILGALPFILVYWLWTQRGQRRWAALLATILAAGGVVQSGLLDRWAGAAYLIRLLNPTGGLIDFYSAGRFDDQSAFSMVVAAAWDYSPVIGIGPGGWVIPYDGALAEALTVAGAVGAVCYAVVLFAMLSLMKIGGSEGRFAFFLTAVVVAGALGFSPLTANRVSTVVWVMISLLVLVRRQSQIVGQSSVDGSSSSSAAAAEPVAALGCGRERGCSRSSSDDTGPSSSEPVSSAVARVGLIWKGRKDQQTQSQQPGDGQGWHHVVRDAGELGLSDDSAAWTGEIVNDAFRGAAVSRRPLRCARLQAATSPGRDEARGER